MEKINSINLERDCEMLQMDSDTMEHCKPFHCGNEDLDDFFLNDAVSYQNEGMGLTYCWVLKNDNTQIVGIVTLANSGLPTTHLPNNPKRHLNKHIPYNKQGRTYPGVLIGRLAVNEDYQKGHYGIGSQIMDFVKIWFGSNNKAACRFIIVDALNTDKTLRFYEKNEFSPLFPRESDERAYYKIRDDEPLRTRMYYYDLI